ncbi:MAG: peptide deformylase, partial [Proteobacteria bacterium]|nr:peptide deformylase [Pseudomonadota bacterium]
MLDILTIPDKRLQKVAIKVDEINDEIRLLAKNMLETMYFAPGIGLAATQVDVHIRLLVLDVSEEKNKP